MTLTVRIDIIMLMPNEIRKDLFEKMPVPKAVLKLAIPTVLAQLVTVVYNLADTLFIGMLNNANMVAAVSLSVSVFMVLVSLANLFGVGGSSVISRSLGVDDVKRASATTTFCIYASIVVTLCISIICLIVVNPLSILLGASVNTLQYTVDYLFWTVVIGGVPMVLCNVISHVVRAEGNAFIAGLGTSIGGVINIILDPIFILVLDMGVTGVAVATMISNVCGVLFFVIYLIIKRNSTIVSLVPTRLKECKKLIIPVLSIGGPAAINSLLVGVSVAFMTKLASFYGDVPLAAIGIVKKIDMLPWSVMFGLTHGILPLIGYNFAAKNFKRMKSIIKFALCISIVLNVVFIVLFETLAPQIVTIFIKDAEVIAYGADFLRIICTCVPFMSIGFLFCATFQAMGKPYHSLVLSVCRQGVIFIPVLFLMNYLCGLTGIVWTQTIADGVFAVLGATLFAIFIKKTEALHEKSKLSVE